MPKVHIQADKLPVKSCQSHRDICEKIVCQEWWIGLFSDFLVRSFSLISPFSCCHHTAYSHQQQKRTKGRIDIQRKVEGSSKNFWSKRLDCNVILWTDHWALSFLSFVFVYLFCPQVRTFFPLLSEREGKGMRERDRNIDVKEHWLASPACCLTRGQTATRTWTLPGNPARDLLVHETTFQPAEPYWPGLLPWFLLRNLSLLKYFLPCYWKITKPTTSTPFSVDWAPLLCPLSLQPVSRGCLCLAAAIFPAHSSTHRLSHPPICEHSPPLSEFMECAFIRARAKNVYFKNWICLVFLLRGWCL